MSGELDKKARDLALTAWFDNTAQGWPAAMDAAILAYLAASPSPSMEMDDLVRKLRDFDQAYSIEFFTPLTEAEKARVGGELRSRIAADMGRHLAQFFVQAADRIEAAESQVLRLTEENEALRRELQDWQNGHGKSVRAHAEALARIEALEEALRAVSDTSYRTKDRTHYRFPLAVMQKVDAALKDNAL